MAVPIHLLIISGYFQAIAAELNNPQRGLTVSKAKNICYMALLRKSFLPLPEDRNSTGSNKN